MTTRPKGYMEWKPRHETMVVLNNVRDILAEYRSYGPMTVRQIFYRLVGQYEYEKTERAYKRLAEYLVKARRSGFIRFGQIRDDGTDMAGGGGWDSKSQFWDSVRSTADRFKLDHQIGQPQEIEIWCEAAGMVPMLASMVREWHIPIYSTGGFSSVTVTYETSQRISESDRPTVLLHIGDFDPSGESIFESMTEDIGAFVASETTGTYRGFGEVEGHFEPRRVALTADQVNEYDLPTAPPKMSDTRSAKWVGETTQAEALPPDLLEKIVTDTVKEYIDVDILDNLLYDEEQNHEDINRVLKYAEDEQ